ncbi:MAG: YigZ family protein [Bacteroidales bacterium]|nr:YigZ family protein [Bacteroidales bacterium]
MINSDSFLSIEQASEGFYKEKASRFLSFAFPVNDENEITQHLLELRKQYHDARHHCYAWKLGYDDNHFRANDDGEPSNSAGKPILGQIQAHDLTNILIVVVRYFGGTLLGVGGLMQAYKSAAAEAIKNASICRQYRYAIYQLHFPYEDMNLVMKVLKDMNLEQWDQLFEMKCSLKLKVRLSEESKLIQSFSLNETIVLDRLET